VFGLGIAVATAVDRMGDDATIDPLGEESAAAMSPVARPRRAPTTGVATGR